MYAENLSGKCVQTELTGPLPARNTPHIHLHMSFLTGKRSLARSVTVRSHITPPTTIPPTLCMVIIVGCWYRTARVRRMDSPGAVHTAVSAAAEPFPCRERVQMGHPAHPL